MESSATWTLSLRLHGSPLPANRERNRPVTEDGTLSGGLQDWTGAHCDTGNTTDVGSTYVRWFDRRRPKYQGTRGFEAERPSQSYVINVRRSLRDLLAFIDLRRCFLLQHAEVIL